jgi:tryptophanase
VDYLAEVIVAAWEQRAEIPGYRITWEAPALRHFTARLDPTAAV